MGRTNPTFRDHLRRYRASWSTFRRALRGRDQSAFDRLFDRARDYADAAGYRNDPDPEIAVVMAMLLAHERELERVDELEQELAELRTKVWASESDVGPPESNGRPSESDAGPPESDD